MSGAKFIVDADSDEGFYVTVADNLTVYEEYEDAVSEIQQKLSGHNDSFIAKITINADEDDDVAVALEQVGWQRVIQDMAVNGGE